MNRTRSFRLGLLLVAVVAFFFVTRAFQGQVSLSDTSINAPQSVSSDAVDGTCSAVVRARVLNQRSEPGTDADVVGQAARGEVFAPQAVDSTGLWLRVEGSSGAAWMYRPYLTLSGDCSAFGTASAASMLSSGWEQSSGEGNAALEGTDALPMLDADNRVLSSLFTDEVEYWGAYIAAWADQYDIDANLIATVIQIESCGDPTVGSSAGAQGLFQVMPFHFEEGEDMLDVATNARRGLNYLAESLEIARGDVRLALAGYNGGHGVIYRNSWAAETRAYVSWGSRIYADASAGQTTSAALSDWLAAGGANLCRRANQSVTAL
jgi:hypothetical protein